MAQREDIFSGPLSFEKEGVIFDDVIQIPKAKRSLLASGNSVHANLKVSFLETQPQRHDEKSKEAKDQWRAGNERLRGVPLWAVAGVLDENVPRPAIKTAEALIQHQFPFKIQGLPIRLKVFVIPVQAKQEMRYGSGEWAYVLTEPRGLILKTGPYAFEEVDVSRCLPEPEGQYGRNKFLMILRALQPGATYRIRLINLEPVSLPAGISASLRLTQPDIVK